MGSHRVAADNRHATGEGLDQHPAELLLPVRVVWLGATSMSIAPRYDGTSSCLASKIRTRSSQPRPWPNHVLSLLGAAAQQEQAPGTFAHCSIARMRTYSPFSCVSRPV